MWCALEGQYTSISKIKQRKYLKDDKRFVCINTERIWALKNGVVPLLRRSRLLVQGIVNARQVDCLYEQFSGRLPHTSTVCKANKCYIVFYKCLFSRSLSLYQYLDTEFLLFVWVVLVCSKLWSFIFFWSLETKALLVTMGWLSWNSLVSLNISS